MMDDEDSDEEEDNRSCEFICGDRGVRMRSKNMWIVRDEWNKLKRTSKRFEIKISSDHSKRCKKVKEGGNVV